MLLFEENIPNSSGSNEGQQDLNAIKRDMQKVQSNSNSGNIPGTNGSSNTTNNINTGNNNSPTKPPTSINNSTTGANINNISKPIQNNINNNISKPIQNNTNNTKTEISKPVDSNNNISTNNKPMSEVTKMSKINAYAQLMEFCMENGIALDASQMNDAKSRFLNEETEIEGIVDVDGEHVDDGSQAEDVVDAAKDTDLEDGQEPDPEDIEGEVDDASDETEEFVNDQDEDTIKNEAYTAMLENLMVAGVSLTEAQIVAVKEAMEKNSAGKPNVGGKALQADILARNAGTIAKSTVKSAKDKVASAAQKVKDAKQKADTEKAFANLDKAKKKQEEAAAKAAKKEADAKGYQDYVAGKTQSRKDGDGKVGGAALKADIQARNAAYKAGYNTGKAADWVKKNPGKAALGAAGVAAATAGAVYGGKKLKEYLAKKKAAKAAAQQEAYTNLIEFCMEAGVALDADQMNAAKCRFLEDAEVEVNINPEDADVEINVDPEEVEASDEEIAAQATEEAYTGVLEFCIENGISLSTAGVKAMQGKFFN